MEININNRNKKICLGRLPSFLGEKILELQFTTEIGELIFDEDEDTGETKVYLKINSSFIPSSEFPKEFNVKNIKRDNNMYVIASSPNITYVEGEIENEYIVTPRLTKTYLDFKRKQSLDKETNVKNTEIIDYITEGKRSEKIGSLRELELLARKRKKMLLDRKRERLSKNEVLDIVFNAFEKYKSWTVKDLADFTGQPTAFIQEIVNEICYINKKDHKNTYELKPEYQ